MKSGEKVKFFSEQQN